MTPCSTRLVHVEEFASAESAERTMSGHDEMWQLSHADVRDLPGSTVPNTGRNLSNSNYRELDEEDSP